VVELEELPQVHWQKLESQKDWL